MRSHFFPTIAGALAAILVFCSPAAAGTSELPAKVGDSDMEIGDRLRIRSTIMGVDPVKQTLKVAEKEVRLLDTSVGGRTLKTRLLDIEGKPAAFSSFKEGELVLVLGYADPNGHVYAMKIQRLDPTAPISEPVSRHKTQLQHSKTKVSSDRLRRTPRPADDR